MSVRVYHQVGHYPTWNISSFSTDKCGDGLILSPVHQNVTTVRALDPKIKARSLFDPQYYLPNSPKAKLASYPFFPQQISGGFLTKDFHLLALESAKECIAFQKEQGFEAVVIPARFIDQMATKYFEQQEDYTVVPFLKAASDVGGASPLYLTVPITAPMLEDEGFRTQLLNWVTGFPEISGVYVLVSDERKSKQIRSSELLFAYMEFLHHAAQSGLVVIAGHLNTESVLLSMIDGITLTFGSFENTRMFSLDKFIESEEERRAPKSRIYLPALLNWIQFDQATEIREEAPKLWASIYTSTSYADDVIARGIEPHFNQPDLYKHHFLCLYNQLKNLGSVDVRERFSLIREHIKNAMAYYDQIEDIPLDLDPHGSSGHLQPWLEALNRYYRAFIK
jgi:hypothetical protein